MKIRSHELERAWKGISKSLKRGKGKWKLYNYIIT